MSHQLYRPLPNDFVAPPISQFHLSQSTRHPAARRTAWYLSSLLALAIGLACTPTKAEEPAVLCGQQCASVFPDLVKPIYLLNPGPGSSCPGCKRDADLDLYEFWDLLVALYATNPEYIPPEMQVVDLGCCLEGSGFTHGQVVVLYSNLVLSAGGSVAFTEMLAGPNNTPLPAETLALVVTEGNSGSALNLSISGLGQHPYEEYATGIHAAYGYAMPVLVPVWDAYLDSTVMTSYMVDRSQLPNVGVSPIINMPRLGIQAEWGPGPFGQLLAQPPESWQSRTAHTVDVNAYSDTRSFTCPMLASIANVVSQLVKVKSGHYDVRRVYDILASSCDRPLAPGDAAYELRNDSTLPSYGPWSPKWGYGVVSAWKAVLFALGYGELSPSDQTPTIISDTFDLRGDLALPAGDSLIVDTLGAIVAVGGAPDAEGDLGLYPGLQEIVVAGVAEVRGSVSASLSVQTGGRAVVQQGGELDVPEGGMLDIASGGRLEIYGDLHLDGVMLLAGTIVVGGSVVIGEEGRLEAHPGASLEFTGGPPEGVSVTCRGTIACLGTEGSCVTFLNAPLGSPWGPLLFAGSNSTSRGVFIYTEFLGASDVVRKPGEGDRARLRFDHCTLDADNTGIDLLGMADGDTLIVTGSTFHGAGEGYGILLTESGSATSTWCANVDGNTVVKHFAVGLDLVGGNSIRVANTVVDSCAEGIAIHGVWTSAGTGPILGPGLEVGHSAGNGIVIGGVEWWVNKPTCQNVTVHHSGFSGIYVAGNASLELASHASGPNVTASNGLHGIVLDMAASGVVVQNITITGNVGSGVRVIASSPTIASATITSSGNGGVYSDASTPIIDGATMSGNYVAIQSTNASTVTVRNSIIAGGSYGISCDATSYGRAGESSEIPGLNQFSGVSQKYGTNLNTSDHLTMVYNCYEGGTRPNSSKFIGLVYYTPAHCPQ